MERNSDGGHQAMLCAAALAYASRGWAVFPCGRDKKPLIAGGFKNASTNPQQIREWWRRWPTASIGSPMGMATGMWCLDVDLPEGPRELEQLETTHGLLPATMEQRTGGGGRQLFFSWPLDHEVRNSAKKLAHGLDVRGEGGYCILPPSGHPSGGTYTWPEGGEDAPAAAAPLWLLDLIAPRPIKGDASPAKTSAKAESTTPYGRAALDAEVAKVANAVKGCRNHELNASAFTIGQLVGGGEVDRSEAEAALLTAAISVGLPNREAEKTILSGIRAGEKEPRRAPKQQPEADVSESSPGTPKTGGLALVRAADVAPEPVNWIWPGHISAGVVHVVDGVPGVGKSMFSCYLAGVLTTGTTWPDGSKADIGNVIIVNLEDDISRTLRPRLEAAGADLERVFMFDDAGDGFTLPADMERLEAAIMAHRAKLVVVDPLMAVLDGKVNSYRDQDVRRVLAALKALCGRTGCAVMLVRHLTKSKEGPAIHRGGGSIGIIGAARVGLLLALDPADNTRRILATIKNNLGPFDPKNSEAWTIAPGPRFEYAGATDLSADDLLLEQEEKRGRGRPDDKQADARRWLQQVLADGSLPSTHLTQLAKASGYSERTLERARKGITASDRVDGAWQVRLVSGS